MTDRRGPADVRLTRQQKQALKVVQANAEITTVGVARQIKARPYYAYNALRTLEAFRWITSRHTEGESVYLDTWMAREAT